MNKNEFGLLLEEWNSFLLKDTSKLDFNFDLFLESCIQLEKEIDVIRESLILENNNLKDVYRLDEIGLIDNFKKALSGFKFRKDSGEKIDPSDSESQNKQVLTKTSKAIMLLFITLKCSQAFAPTAHIDVNELKAPIAHEITDSDVKTIKNMPDDKIKELAKSLPPAAKDEVKSKIKKMVTKKVKKEVKKIKVNKAKAEKLKSKKAKAKATKKIEKAAQEIVKKTKKVVDEVKKIGKKSGMDYDLESVEKELMADPDIKAAIEKVTNEPHGKSGENEFLSDSSTSTLDISDYYNTIKNAVDKIKIDADVMNIKLNYNKFDPSEHEVTDLTDNQYASALEYAKVLTFKRLMNSDEFKQSLSKYVEKISHEEGEIAGKTFVNDFSSADGTQETKLLAFFLDCQPADSDGIKNQYVDKLGFFDDADEEEVIDYLLLDIDNQAESMGVDSNSQTYKDFKSRYKQALMATSVGTDISTSGGGFKNLGQDIARGIDTKMIRVTDTDSQ